VAGGDEDLLVEQLVAAALAVDVGGVGDVVAVALEPADERVLGVPEGVAVAVDQERPVVRHLVGPPGGRGGPVRPVEAGAAPPVVGVHGGVGGLQHDVGRPPVVAHDEQGPVADARLVEPVEVGDVDAGHGVRGHGPAGRDGPVAAVDEPDGRVLDRRRLRLGQRDGGRDVGDLAGPVTPVPPHAVDPDAPVVRGRLDLEVDRLPGVDADVGRETLDAVVLERVPLALGVARERVLVRDGRRRGADLVGERPDVESDRTSADCCALEERSASERAERREPALVLLAAVAFPAAHVVCPPCSLSRPSRATGRDLTGGLVLGDLAAHASSIQGSVPEDALKTP
jgi:hypothetical protein